MQTCRNLRILVYSMFVIGASVETHQMNLLVEGRWFPRRKMVGMGKIAATGSSAYIASFESHSSSSFSNSISSIWPSWTSRNHNYPKQSSWIKPLIKKFPSFFSIFTCTSQFRPFMLHVFVQHATYMTIHSAINCLQSARSLIYHLILVTRCPFCQVLFILIIQKYRVIWWIPGGVIYLGLPHTHDGKQDAQQNHQVAMIKILFGVKSARW